MPDKTPVQRGQHLRAELLFLITGQIHAVRLHQPAVAAESHAPAKPGADALTGDLFYL